MSKKSILFKIIEKHCEEKLRHNMNRFHEARLHLFESQRSLQLKILILVTKIRQTSTLPFVRLNRLEISKSPIKIDHLREYRFTRREPIIFHDMVRFHFVVFRFFFIEETSAAGRKI